MLRPDYRQYRLSKLLQDPYISSYHETMRLRRKKVRDTERRITNGSMDLLSFASGHEYYGLHFKNNTWILREWAPNVEKAFVVGPFSDWKESQKFEMKLLDRAGNWELILPAGTLKHGDLYKLHFHWQGGHGERIPAYARRVVQDDATKIFSAQVWNPPVQYRWKHPEPERNPEPPIIYEAHVGLAQERAGMGTYAEFRKNVLPRIAKAGYNTIQLMAVMEHPYYGSFGYHVSSFFAASISCISSSGVPNLDDAAHGKGIAVEAGKSLKFVVYGM